MLCRGLVCWVCKACVELGLQGVSVSRVKFGDGNSRPDEGYDLGSCFVWVRIMLNSNTRQASAARQEEQAPGKEGHCDHRCFLDNKKDTKQR